MSLGGIRASCRCGRCVPVAGSTSVADLVLRVDTARDDDDDDDDAALEEFLRAALDHLGRPLGLRVPATT
jgi:Tfp pilus assembly protein PilW